MFKKPFRVKSQTSMKGSDRKKVRVEIQKSFSNLSVEDVNTIIPNKEDVSSVKIHTNTGENAFIYCVNKQPLLFELDKQKVLYPTVYLLWRYPDLMERFTTWPPVFKKLVDGADLMLPGLVLRLPLTPGSFKHVEKGQVCSVNVVGNRCPIVVGTTLLSGSDFFDSGMRGKGIHPVHLYGDELWAFGDRSKPPEAEDDPLPEELYMNHEEGHEPTEPSDGTGEVKRVEAADNNVHEAKADNVIEPSHKTGNLDRELATDNSVHEVNAEIVGEESVEGEVNGTEAEMTESVQGIHDENIAENWVEEHNGDKKSSLGDSNNSESGCGDEEIVEGTEQLTLCSEVETPQPMSTEETDELLEFCFLCSIKASLKKTDLPLATGTFYKNHMLKYCPKGKYLDIKKSSYKKLSKFLQKQQKSGIILVKEVTKGVDAVVEIDKSHELSQRWLFRKLVLRRRTHSSRLRYLRCLQSQPTYSPLSKALDTTKAVPSKVLT
ncbi:hypothetical protein DPMN_154960 [Dreissena polymorpha]|uniref:Eukaryotic translation initiation factor 2D n=1 Tax=Dreissena polymorpha TaxID=45954 RepID=A0A9D4FN17_DREPO|nr:hypothetical protein DPMN_154960 [Dreissena polymorpha]